MSSTRPLVVYGAGGFAREIGWLLEQGTLGPTTWELVCFVDDRPERQGGRVHDVPVLGLEQAMRRFPGAHAAVGVGAPAERARMADRLAAAGLPLATLVHRDVHWSRWNELGAGSIIQCSSHVTVDVVIGRCVVINGATVGHDVRVGDYSVINPGANVSGWVHIGERVTIGAGATIRPGTRDAPLPIGDDAVVGASACVVRPVPAGVTVVGVPAVPRDRAGGGGRP